MKIKTLNRITATVIILMLLLTLCSCGRSEEEIVVSDSPYIADEPADVPESGSENSSTSGSTFFSIRFFPDITLNPMTCVDTVNDTVTSLIYEGLFRLDNHFKPVNVLCDNYTSEDGLNFYFSIIDCYMHDGEKLTVADVVYSINFARTAVKYSSRLSNILFCGATSDGLVEIKLDKSDFSLPALLDIPIIRANSGTLYSPPGTGPYIYNEIGSYYRLTPFEQYRNPDSIPYNAVYLQVLPDNEVVSAFENRQLSAIWDDELDDEPVNLHSSFEIHRYDTTIMQFIGFNSHSTPMSNVSMRRAVACAVDRDYIKDKIFKGRCRTAPLIINSNYYAYSDLWENQDAYTLDKLTSYLDDAELRDDDGDGYLEYPVFGEYQHMFIKFIACADSPEKLEAARSIADKLSAAGLYIDFVELGWNDFVSALNNRSFDLYYAEASFPHDFDFSIILSPYSKFDFGEMGTSDNDLLCRAFLDATTDENKLSAAKTLCTVIQDNATIVPVLYRQYVTYAQRGAILNFMPTISGVFSNVTEWAVQ